MKHHKLESDILIVDDEVRLAQLLQVLLGWEGYPTRLAQDGRTAISLIEEHSPTVVITDLMMPGVDGYELISYIRQNAPSIPVIAVTGFGSIDSAIKALQMGAINYILKPFHNSLMLETVERAVKQARYNHYEYLRQQIILAVGSALPLDSMLEKVLALVKQGVGAEDGTLLILDEQGLVVQNIQPTNAWFTSEGAESLSGFQEQIMENGLAGWLYRTRQGFMMADTAEDKRWLDLPGQIFPIKSVIGLPFISRDVVQGLILLIHSTINRFDDLDLQFLETIALPVAMAIENARLFQQTQAQKQQLLALQADISRLKDQQP